MKKTPMFIPALATLITLTALQSAQASSSQGFVGLGGSYLSGGFLGQLEGGFNVLDLGTGDLGLNVAAESDLKTTGFSGGLIWVNGENTQTTLGVGGFYRSSAWGGYARVGTQIPIMGNLKIKPQYEYTTTGESKFSIGLVLDFPKAITTPNQASGAEWSF